MDSSGEDMAVPNQNFASLLPSFPILLLLSLPPSAFLSPSSERSEGKEEGEVDAKDGGSGRAMGRAIY